jgi:hypothetical protein
LAGYLSEIFHPPSFSEQSDAHHIETLRDWIPQRWRHGERDSVESVVGILGEARDHALYRKVGAESWEDYCASFLSSPAAAMDELIEGVRILKGQLPGAAPISEDAARRAAAERARVQAETIKPRARTDLQLRDAVTQLDDDRGNSTAYLLRRIARKSPETLAAYEAGKFSTVRQAARAAGIPDEVRRVSLGDPERLAEKVLGMGRDYAEAVAQALLRRIK